MIPIIDIIEKHTSNNKEIYVPEKYIGHECVVMYKDNVTIENGKITNIKNPNEGFIKLIRPSLSAGRFGIPITYTTTDVVVLIRDLY